MASRENQQYIEPLPNNAAIDHFHIDHNAPGLPPKTLHNHCLQFSPGFHGRPKKF